MFDVSRPSPQWRGLRFQRASHSKMLTAGDTLYQKFSDSKLFYVDVFHAGVGILRQVGTVHGRTDKRTGVVRFVLCLPKPLSAGSDHCRAMGYSIGER